ncbi:hypothetical protein PMAYCL1PPCAC_13136, partial [Pristionchus mayeri]
MFSLPTPPRPDCPIRCLFSPRSVSPPCIECKNWLTTSRIKCLKDDMDNYDPDDPSFYYRTSDSLTRSRPQCISTCIESLTRGIALEDYCRNCAQWIEAYVVARELDSQMRKIISARCDLERHKTLLKQSRLEYRQLLEHGLHDLPPLPMLDVIDPLIGHIGDPVEAPLAGTDFFARENQLELTKRLRSHSKRADYEQEGLIPAVAVLSAEEEKTKVLGERKMRRRLDRESKLTYTRACWLCRVMNPVERAMYKECGHIVCLPCAEDAREKSHAEVRDKCPMCRT